MKNLDRELFQSLLTAPDLPLPWNSPALLSAPWWQAMEACPQDPIHHAEGDVATHTRLVVEAMQASDAWRGLPDDERGMLLLTALLHDIAKPETTRTEAGRITARGHSGRGETQTRRRLYECSGIPLAARESIAGLIRFHQRPFYLIDRADAAREAIRISHSGTRADHLAILAEADARGRLCADGDALLLQVALFRAFCEEQGCLNAPYPFASDESRFVYFRTDGARDPAYHAYETPGRPELILMSGLPGAGKDTYLRQNLADLPVVSLDAIRARMGVAPDEPQERVADAARSEAKVYLRRGESVVWNATNLNREIRAARVRLAEDYGARVRIVYVEVPADVLRRQNRSREEDAVVPDAAMGRMLRRWEMPDATEAHRVEWVIRDSYRNDE